MGVRETTPLFFSFFLREIVFVEDMQKTARRGWNEWSKLPLISPAGSPYLPRKEKQKKKTADCKTRRERKGKRKRFDPIWEERFACNSSLHETKEISFVQRRERVFVDTPALLDRHKDCWCMYTQQCSGSIRSLIEIPLAQHLHSLMRSRNNI